MLFVSVFHHDRLACASLGLDHGLSWWATQESLAQGVQVTPSSPWILIKGPEVQYVKGREGVLLSCLRTPFFFPY